MPPQQPRIARETRLLLGIVAISLATLWGLARLRFPDQPRIPDPVAPVLAQFAPASPFDAIATAVSEVERRVSPSLTEVIFTPRASDPAVRPTQRVAVRLDRDIAVVIVPRGDGTMRSSPDVVDVAPRTGVGLIRLAPAAPVSMASWATDRVPSARFVIAAEAAREGVSFRPVFVGVFTPVQGTLWPDVVWRLPASTALTDGALVFTDDGLLVGAVAVRGGERLLVPASTLLSVVHGVGQGLSQPRGVLGVAVQEITDLVADALGTSDGVVVTWVDPKGAAAGVLQPLDVIESLGGRAVTSREQWDDQLDHLAVGDALVVQMRRPGTGVRTVTLTARAPVLPDRPAPLGAVLRTRARVGAEVVGVVPGAAADHAGLRTGDLITAIGALAAPTATQVTQAYKDAAADGPLPVAVTRGASHMVRVLEQSW